MSFSHRSLPIHAVQYHPESIITIQGRAIIESFVSSKNSIGRDASSYGSKKKF
jgi:hypothetical protein